MYSEYVSPIRLTSLSCKRKNLHIHVIQWLKIYTYIYTLVQGQVCMCLGTTIILETFAVVNNSQLKETSKINNAKFLISTNF